MKRSRILIIIITLYIAAFGGYAQEQIAQQNSAEQEYFNKVRSVMHDQPDNSSDNANNKSGKPRRSSVDVWAYIRIIVVLALMIGVIYAIFLVMKKFLKVKEDTGDGVQLLTSRTLGPGKQVQVVFVHGRYLILGVTNDNINLLGEITDPKEIEHIELYANEQAAQSGQTFGEIITNMYKRLFGKKTAEDKSFDYETDEGDFLRKQQEKLKSNDNPAKNEEDENE